MGINFTQLILNAQLGLFAENAKEFFFKKKFHYNETFRRYEPSWPKDKELGIICIPIQKLYYPYPFSFLGRLSVWITHITPFGAIRQGCKGTIIGFYNNDGDPMLTEDLDNPTKSYYRFWVSVFVVADKAKELEADFKYIEANLVVKASRTTFFKKIAWFIMKWPIRILLFIVVCIFLWQNKETIKGYFSRNTEVLAWAEDNDEYEDYDFLDDEYGEPF